MNELSDPEIQRIRDAYRRRRVTSGPVDLWVLYTRQERERAIARWAREEYDQTIETTRLIELGCGTGGNLADLIRLGFSPGNLCGVDLIEERIAQARRLLPNSVTLHCGEAATTGLVAGSFDVVFQSMMCSSVLDEKLVKRIAARMWSLVRAGGGVLWYDMIFDNPRNPDVRGIAPAMVRSLFPVAPTWMRRLTLAPPVSRVVTAIHPSLYTLFNRLPFLRTHILCWIRKPA